MIAEGVAEAFQLQGMLCRQLGSPLYASLLEQAHDNLLHDGIISEVVEGWRGNPIADVLPLRLVGAVHHLVLAGSAPDLAPYYPSVGGTPQWPNLWNAFADVVRRHRDFVRTRLDRQVQTNEVSRSAALLGGFLHVAAHTHLPLRLFEIGSSAGLNLYWDRYRYEIGEQRWGDPASPVVIRAQSHGSAKFMDAPVQVDGRFGCDLSPIDVNDDDQVRTLESFFWPDQLERLAQLRCAIALARTDPPQLTRQTAAEFLETRLCETACNVTTVVFHSTMWWYLPESEQKRATEIIEERGARATNESPLAWMQLEIRSSERADLVVRLWPGGEEVVLASSHAHGREVWWEE